MIVLRHDHPVPLGGRWQPPCISMIAIAAALSLFYTDADNKGGQT
jgi:hypothetical protein